MESLSRRKQFWFAHHNWIVNQVRAKLTYWSQRHQHLLAKCGVCWVALLLSLTFFPASWSGRAERWDEELPGIRIRKASMVSYLHNSCLRFMFFLIKYSHYMITWTTLGCHCGRAYGMIVLCTTVIVVSVKTYNMWLEKEAATGIREQTYNTSFSVMPVSSRTSK